MATKKDSKAVAKKEEAQVPAHLQALMNSDAGNEGVGADDLVIPRLELVQSISPCRKKSDPAYIEGAEDGMMFNNVTRELYGEEITVIPLYFVKEFLIWKDRKQGGGFRGAYQQHGEAKQALADLAAAGENGDSHENLEIVDTAQQYCLLVKEDGSLEEIVISMAKSKMKVNRRWNSMIRLNGGPRFSRCYKLSCVEDQNDAGDSFYNLAVSNERFVTEDELTRSQEVYEMIKSGRATVNREQDDISDVADTESAEM